MSLLLSVWPLLAAVVCFLVYLHRRHSRYWISKGVPSASNLPVIGSFLGPLTQKISLTDFFNKCYKSTDYGLYGIFIFHKPGLVIRDPKLIKQIMIKDFQSFYDKYNTTSKMHDPVGYYSLVFIKGREWDDLRKQLSPGFTPIRMKSVFPFLKQVGEELHQFISNGIKDSEKKEFHVDMKELFANYTTDTISSFALGIKANSINNPNSELRTHGRKVFELQWYRMFESLAIFFIPQIVHLFKCKVLPKKTTDFFRKVTHEVINNRERSGENRNDFIDLLVKLKNSPTVDGFLKVDGDVMVGQTAIFFSAGFDTSATLGAFCLYEMAKNPKYQEILGKEIRDVLDRNNGELSYDSINEMEYLHMVVEETLRKYPPMSFVERVCTQEGGYRLPEPYQHITLEYGTPVYLSLCGMHGDPKYYPNPHIFDPQRFSKEAKQSRIPYSYLPFGTGPRTCIGERLAVLQAKIGIINCLRDYVISTCSNTPDEIILNPKTFLVMPIGGLPLKIQKRNLN